MMKRLIKTALAAGLHRSGVARAIGALPSVKALPLVLAYHSVVEDLRPYIGRAQLPNLISTGMLERQLDWVGRRYRFVSLDELGRRLERGEARALAAVTFDDGYVDVYHHAAPLLKRKGIPAAVFVITDAVGRPQLQHYDKLYLLLGRVLPVLGHSDERLRKLFRAQGVELGAAAGGVLDDAFRAMRWLFTTLTQRQLQRAIKALETVVPIDDRDYPELHSVTWGMARAMAASGFTIGSHSDTHALLTEESPEQVAVQTQKSFATLEAQLQRPPEHFAYPDGRFNPAVVSAVARAGYRFAYGTCLRRDARHPHLTIPRTLLWEQSSVNHAGAFSPSVMGCHAHHVFDMWRACSHDHRDLPPAVSGVEAMAAGPATSIGTRRAEGMADRLNV